jgi:serine/threonine protein phosphatase PrpC
MSWGSRQPRFETARIVEAYRPVGEDRAEVIETAFGLVLVVADGAGGRPGGGEAAEMVVREVREAAAAARRPLDPRDWGQLLTPIDEAMADDPEAGEATAVVAVISAAGIAGASAGDSEAWLIGPNDYHELTGCQHSKPFLGTSAAVPVPFSARRFEGTLLVASDGLFKYADPDGICAAARQESIDQAARDLVDLVRLRSGSLPDDVPVILCRVVG